ncbi:hypothetical protein SAMD00019534_066830 [Acytostelium subglobosum LB1]|uniref:hypothetical protein n=1 Tax=Acytostelium subglobosum LB1 TaxID=1410327 RepID=UPI000644EAD2|nr:hypothetical protein SAMD00019534_066830 [Acytostelium subglobosum LB1]GAM23508.1 hypothetical protein SAMD00019534_066830 [Acytostelium subglobosum LB1]|eukprot:XP_012753249.1 hypothetical protein SAMD00019534_066830 [Acytostelium subglobosum LB1]
MKFYLTGFGKFNGVEDNPTTHLMNNIVQHYKQTTTTTSSSSLPITIDVDTVRSAQQQQQQQQQCSVVVDIVGVDILEVSAVSAKQKIDQLAQQYPNDHITLIHFGVDSNAQAFRLERCGWNEANFRVPDERGWQPANESIDANDTNSHNVTSIPITNVVSNLSPKHLVQPSDDPGRFICNYIYYHSLTLSKQSQGRVHSLFVHVPPFHVISMDKQLEFVVDLLQNLSTTLCKSINQ